MSEHEYKTTEYPDGWTVETSISTTTKNVVITKNRRTIFHFHYFIDHELLKVETQRQMDDYGHSSKWVTHWDTRGIPVQVWMHAFLFLFEV